MARWEEDEKLLCRKCGLLFEDETGYGGDICNPCLTSEIEVRRAREKRQVARMLASVSSELLRVEALLRDVFRNRSLYSDSSLLKRVVVNIRALRFAKKCLEDNPDLWLYALDGRCLI